MNFVHYYHLTVPLSTRLGNTLISLGRMHLQILIRIRTCTCWSHTTCVHKSSFAQDVLFLSGFASSLTMASGTSAFSGPRVFKGVRQHKGICLQPAVVAASGGQVLVGGKRVYCGTHES